MASKTFSCSRSLHCLCHILKLWLCWYFNLIKWHGQFVLFCCVTKFWWLQIPIRSGYSSCSDSGCLAPFESVCWCDTLTTYKTWLCRYCDCSYQQSLIALYLHIARSRIPPMTGSRDFLAFPWRILYEFLSQVPSVGSPSAAMKLVRVVFLCYIQAETTNVSNSLLSHKVDVLAGVHTCICFWRVRNE